MNITQSETHDKIEVKHSSFCEFMILLFITSLFVFCYIKYPFPLRSVAIFDVISYFILFFMIKRLKFCINIDNSTETCFVDKDFFNYNRKINYFKTHSKIVEEFAIKIETIEKIEYIPDKKYGFIIDSLPLKWFTIFSSSPKIRIKTTYGNDFKIFYFKKSTNLFNKESDKENDLGESYRQMIKDMIKTRQTELTIGKSEKYDNPEEMFKLQHGEFIGVIILFSFLAILLYNFFSGLEMGIYTYESIKSIVFDKNNYGDYLIMDIFFFAYYGLLYFTIKKLYIGINYFCSTESCGVDNDNFEYKREINFFGLYTKVFEKHNFKIMDIEKVEYIPYKKRKGFSTAIVPIWYIYWFKPFKRIVITIKDRKKIRIWNFRTMPDLTQCETKKNREFIENNYKEIKYMIESRQEKLK